jgi:asparagine synthase (glutamine-hydrolysing)
MCGISGILNYSNTNSSIDESLLKRMSDAIAHRGPDDEGQFISPKRNCGFGFRRLSIVDLSPAGHQPMRTADGKFTIMLNGEIYNHLVVRKELERLGYRYNSRSDTETVLYAYQEYGLEFVHKLLGMFALAIWDETKQRLVLVRDRIGVKPIYYSFTGGSLVFASEIKALLVHPDVHRELNHEALSHYLTFLVPPAPMTLFKNIYKLEAGTMMVVEADGDARKHQYWDPVPIGPQATIDLDGTPVSQSQFFDPTFSMDEESCVATIRTMLRQSVKDRMMSDVPFGVFLSGGIDSTTNVALMAELMDRPVDTFSVGFRGLEQFNELGYARQVSNEFKTNHHEVIIDAKAAFDFLPALVHHQDEPIADPVCIPLYFVSKLARDNGTIVVQVGEGSDEQFAGYSWMKRELQFHDGVWKTFQALPGGLRGGISTVGTSLLRMAGNTMAADYLRRATQGEELYWGGAVNFTESHKAHLFSEPQPSSSPYVRGWHEQYRSRNSNGDYLKEMAYLEFKHRLPELLLMRVDKMSMAASVEARVPFLDHRIVEYSMRIPRSLKLRYGEPKYLLKKAVEGIIPQNIIGRKKQGFAAPIDEWLRSDWSAFVEHTLMGSELVRTGVFRSEAIKDIIQQNKIHKRLAGQNLWNLLNLTMWHRHWIEGKS